MKLKNKRTGEIKEIQPLTTGGYRSLAELNADWEDYEEPKEWWFIDCTGSIKHGEGLFTEKSYIKDIQEIGNYFETEEEAELAVRKLKAWKRLRDGGFVFCGKGDCLDTIRFDYGPAGYNNQDFNLLFGGEE